MQRSLLILCMLYLGLIAGNPGYAQCNITQASGSSDFPTSIGVGQSFTATCDGTLDYIKIKPKSDGTGFSIVVYEGDGLSGTELVNRSGINIRANGGDFVSIDLSSEGISLTSGSKYTFFINWSQDIGYANGPVYAEGKVYYAGSSFTNVDLAFEVGMKPVNTSPTAAGFTANPKEGTLYAFATGDFSYSDGDSDPLDHITVTAPASGTLFIDSNDNDTEDVGEVVPDAADVSKADLDAGRLKYLPDGSTSSSFTFKVNDGTDYSEWYTATLTVNARPTVSISSTSTNPTSDNPVPISITFSEAVTGFTVGDLGLSNASASNFSGSDASYSVDLTPTTEGEITLDIAAGVASDAGSAGNKAASQFSITYDATPPTASITTEEPDPTDASPFSISISPSETITGLTADDLQVSNGSVTSFTAPGFSYQQTIGTGRSGGGDDQFYDPSGVSVASDGKVYVTEGGNHRVQVFNADYSYHATIGTGTSGSNNDQFEKPYGVSVASDGKVYVADRFNHRIQVFNDDYSYHATIGTTGTAGSENDQFNSPTGVSVSSDGKVYVADRSNHRIQVFNADYSYYATIGTGTEGSGNDELHFPTGVSVASNGKVYVADQFNHRVQVFNADYSYHATIGTGTQGSNNDAFNLPDDVSVGPEGKIYVADLSNHRIQVFNSDYSYHATIGTGTSGRDNDQFNFPPGVSVSSDGKVYVADFNNHRIQVFEQSTDYRAEITPDAEGEVGIEIAAGAFSDEAGIASTEAATFSIYYDTAVPTVAISSAESGFTDQSPFAVSIVFSEEMIGFEAGDISVTNGTAGNLQSSDNITFTADITPAGDGEVKVEVGAGVATDLGGRDNTAAEAFSITYDVTPPTASITTEEPAPTDASPFSITISPSEAITGLTAEDLQVTNGSVTSFTPPQYVYRQTIGTGIEGSSNDAFHNPWGISIASDGKIYVADRTNHRIQIFDANGDYLATMGTTGSAGSGDNQFNYPGGVTPASDGNIYVADYQINHRVQVFDANGDYLATMGTTGTFGSGNNQFNRPYDVAVADDGKIYVADFNNHRIQVFDADRNYLATMGTSGTFGTGDNQFSFPREITIASDGKIYVVDEGNHRIQVFDADRNYLATLGTGSRGSANDEFWFPNGLALDPDGKIYISDRRNHRIQVFDAERNYLATIGTTGTFGSSNDEFYDPQDVAVAPDGKIYVVDSRNNRVQVFESLTGYQAEITPDAEGEVGIEIAAGAFSDEAGIASTEAATFSIYYDTAVPTVAISSAESGFTDQSPFAVSIVFSEEMIGFEAGDISVTNGTAGNLQSSDNITFTADITPAGDGEVKVEVGAGVATDLGGRDNTAAEAFRVNYDVLPPTATITSEETDPTKVNPIAITITPSETITGLTSDDLQVSNGSVTSFIPVYVYGQTIGTGIKGSSNDTFNGPCGLSVAPDGNVYVADQTNHRIQVFDADGNYLTTMGTGTRGSGNDSFNNPISVSVASDGKIYVVDFNNHRIQVFDADRNYLATMGIPATSGSGNDKFNGPSSVSVAPDGKIYVADNNNHRIQVFDANRNYLATIGGTQGSDNNELSFPIGVSVASDGKIYVADRFNHRIQVFDADRNYLATIGTSGISGSVNDAFNKPAGVTVPSDGKIYVADRDNHRIQIFDADRNYLATIGTGTQGSGNEDLNNPTGVAISPDGIIYVADFNNHRIQVFEQSTDYQAEITPAAEGEVSVEIAAGTFSDLSGKDNVEAASFSIRYDVTAPTVSISSAEGELNNTSPFLASFTFSEEVSGFTAEDISVTNGTAANLQSSDNITFTAEITPATDGEVSLSVAAGLAADLAGNLSEASNSLGIRYDGTAPTVSITADEEGQTDQKTFEVTFSFSEVVSGFGGEDVTLENATLSALSSSDDKIFTATLTAVSGGTVSVSLAEGQATDAAGNGNVASEVPFSILFDQAPVITADQSFEMGQISPEGSLLGRISATDVTEGTTLQDWTIVSVTEGEATAEGIFTIDASTGEISVSQSGGLGNESRDFVLTLTVSDGTRVSKPAQVTISYRPVNQAPSFVKGEDISLLPGAGDYRYAGWASQISAGPAGEAGQQLSFVVSNDQPDFFTSPPVINTSGELSFSLADNVSGTVTVTVQLKDDGGTANGGVDSSAPVTFTINVDKIAQTITFAPLQDVKVGQDPIVLAATGGDSGAPVMFSISTEPAQGVARLEGNRLIIEDVGEVTVTATQAGNDTYQEAEPVVRRFSITTNALFLPSAFTPNGDGSNDHFILRGGGGVASIEFTIYDRSRNVVFRSTDWEEITGQGWDGTYQGRKQPLGIYIWTLQGSYRNGQPLEVGGKKSGIIRLIR